MQILFYDFSIFNHILYRNLRLGRHGAIRLSSCPIWKMAGTPCMCEHTRWCRQRAWIWRYLPTLQLEPRLVGIQTTLDGLHSLRYFLLTNIGPSLKTHFYELDSKILPYLANFGCNIKCTLKPNYGLNS